jgi:poly(A) polymerase
MSEDATPNSSKPRSTREDALAVVRRLREAGHVAYFAGGCVRDALLGLDPKDYDVATDAPPARVRGLFPRTQAVGAAFGVILVRQGGSQVEVATFRSDGRYVDGRRPEGVVFTNAEEDAKRRDFTINGMFYDPIEDRVIDYVGGQQDLKDRVLRAIGRPEERFEEDHLRLLRAIRFAARFDLAIEDATDLAIELASPHLVRISPERIAEELRIMLTATSRGRAWQMIRRYKLDEVIFRFAHHHAAATRTAAQPEWPVAPAPRFFERVLPEQIIGFGLALAAAALEHAVDRLRLPMNWPVLPVRPLVHALRQSLRISNDEADAMQGCLEGVERLVREQHPSVATLKRLLAKPTASLSRALLAALPAELAGNRGTIETRLRELEETEYAPAPLITGDDLTAAGLQPGKAFKVALDVVYDAQLEGRVMTRDQALELAIRAAQGAG